MLNLELQINRKSTFTILKLQNYDRTGNQISHMQEARKDLQTQTAWLDKQTHRSGCWHQSRPRLQCSKKL